MTIPHGEFSAACAIQKILKIIQYLFIETPDSSTITQCKHKKHQNKAATS